ncbi:MAG: energy transducer TonB [Cereibacter sphaeroides]|uniref:Energy transducer TonB n=1 Tax=Cereibacter sphaeroides TaxID=1063 RepID=A0A2W5SE67_CERSP|nr:MAG: energy transducer TonB [Cereibacter sphaeroides]
MTTAPARPHVADWTASLSGRHHAADAAAWTLSAVVVAAALAGGVALALWLERQAGNEDAIEEAMLIDLPPQPPPPAMTAAAEAAPDQPQVEAPDQTEPTEISETIPDLPEEITPPEAPPPPEQTELAQLTDLPMDSLAPPPPPPEPEPVVEEEKEKPPEPEPKPEPKPKVEKKKLPAPSVASRKTNAQSSATGEGQVSVSAGQMRDLKATWGAAIRKRVERRKSYPSGAGNASGTATVRIVVSRGGGLSSVSLSRSSGNPALDDAAVRAVRSAGSFPAAPTGLTDASYTFSLPINFSR